MEYEADVAIIGAGPAGSTAAYILAKLGLNVILIDKSSFPRDKLCGGLISSKTIKLLENIFDETERSLNDKKIINFSSNKFQFVCKNKILSKSYTKLPTHFVERIVYDNFLLEKSISQGVKFIQEEEVKEVNLESNTIVTSKENKIRSNYLIGAEGANSIVRREFEKIGILDKNIWQDNLGFAVETTVEKEKTSLEPDFMYLHFGYIKTGYAWVFPNKDRLVIGIGGLLKNIKNNNLKNIFADFLMSLDLDRKTVATCIKEMKGHPIPFGNFIEKPVYKKTILIGDAAGFVNSVTGEGIYYAQKSAEIAAEAIIKDYTNQGKLEENLLKNLNLYLLPELSKIRNKRETYFKIFNNYYIAKIVTYFMFRNIKHV